MEMVSLATNAIMMLISFLIMKLSVFVNNLTSKMYQMNVNLASKDVWSVITLKLVSLVIHQKASLSKEDYAFVVLVSMMNKVSVWLVSEVAKFVRIKRSVQLVLMKNITFLGQIQHVYAIHQSILSMTEKIASVNLVFILTRSKIHVKSADWAVVNALQLIFVQIV